GLLAFPVRRWVMDKWGPRAALPTPSYSWRIVAAVAGTIANILFPTLAVAALLGLFAITVSQQSHDAAFPNFVFASGGSLVLFIVVTGLTAASLSPNLPAWRIIPVPPKAAAKLGGRVVLGAGLLLLIAILKTGVSSPRTF